MIINEGICTAPPRQPVCSTASFESIGNSITYQGIIPFTAHCVLQYDALGNGDITLQRAHIRKGLGVEVDFLML